MLDNIYPIGAKPDLRSYQFISHGPQGSVTKVVLYKQDADNPSVYYLGFGDLDEKTGALSDTIVTNNGDSQKVLATVTRTLYLFTERYPDAVVYAEGSTPARTRLYQMGIANNLEAVQRDYEVLGFTTEGWEDFKKAVTYEAFVVRRKILDL